MFSIPLYFSNILIHVKGQISVGNIFFDSQKVSSR